ncbi:zinc ribbon domain-containing protein [Alkaliphilus crotonatoxidans]
MSWIERLSNGVSETAKNIGKRSTEVVEISKLSMSIRRKEEEISKRFEEMGQYIYGRLKKLNLVTRDELYEMLREVEALEEEIRTYERLILSIRNIAYCDHCQIELEEDARYCPLCGRSVSKGMN